MSNTSESSDTTTLTRVTLNMVPKAAADLAAAMEMTGLSKTDVINRAVTAYAFIERAMRDGGQLVVEDKDRKRSVIQFL